MHPLRTRTLFALTGATCFALLAVASSAAADTPELRWPPPRLQSPITIKLGTGFTVSRLDDNRDYIVKLPPTLKTGGTVIEGGHNVVMEGGHVTVPPDGSADFERRAIYVKGATGTVHIEGVLIEGTPRAPMDAIAIDAPEASVQIENVRATGITGSEVGFHADIVQPSGGVHTLRIDRLTGASNYQGIFIPPVGGIVRTVIQRVNLIQTPTVTDGGGYMLWMDDNCATYPVSLRDIFVRSARSRPFGLMVHPWIDQVGCKPTIDGDISQWPDSPIKGSVDYGDPPHGDFVPRRKVGVAYESPGYQRKPSSRGHRPSAWHRAGKHH